MMRVRAIPVRIDDRVSAPADRAPEFDTTMALGVIFWMGLVGLTVIAAAL